MAAFIISLYLLLCLSVCFFLFFLLFFLFFFPLICRSLFVSLVAFSCHTGSLGHAQVDHPENTV
jgi:hypothetical protein